MTNLQLVMLSKLRDEFGVDVAPALGLEGRQLEDWIQGAEDRLFDELTAKND